MKLQSLGLEKDFLRWGKDKELEEAGERKEIGGLLIEVEFMSGGA